MDEKSLTTLEYFKVLERLEGYAAFSASAEVLRARRPVNALEEARRMQALTSEARFLLSVNSGISVGGARDVRPQVDLAGHGGVLLGTDLLEVKNTLAAARELRRTFEKYAPQAPSLAEIAAGLQPPSGVVDAITRAISDRGEVLDQASEKLAGIRRERKVSHERLLSRLERMVNDPRNAPMLQEALITQRNGRYVIPLRAEFKGRIRSITHDQSASGATLFVEPLAVVELNNRVHEMELAERDEEQRILAELSGLVGRNMGAILGLVAALAQFDAALACAQFAEDLHACEPLLEPFRTAEGRHPGSTIRLYQARHPLLDPGRVVPIDVDLDAATYALVITGPNTGGKTVTLKTVGLLALMAQSGLHIPALSGSCLSLFEDVYADIGDEQSIEQSLSTFSGHITNIVRILRQATPRSLVLFDELGAGTDPQEGAALARSILEFLMERPVTCLVATHYPELKAFAHIQPGAINASMEFNLRTLRPTYHLIVGLPGRSNALLIAERLGLLPEIIQSARKEIPQDDRRAENLLDEIHRQRDAARRARAAAEQKRQEAEKMRLELKHRLDAIESERVAVLETARAAAGEEADALRLELDDVRRSLQRARQPLEGLQEIRQQVDYLQDQAQKPVRRQKMEESLEKPLRVGEKVRLRAMGMQGVVTALDGEEVEVQAGALRLRVPPADLLRAGEKEEAQKPQPPERRPAQAPTSRHAVLVHPSPGMELDLRGRTSEEALEALADYLDDAYLAGMPFVRIIHGKGTGKLRQEVRQALRRSEHVKSWTAGQDGEGGDGVSVAHLKQE